MKKLSLFLVLFVAMTISMPVSLSFAAKKSANDTALVLTEKVNINTSSEVTLTTVPGIGPKTAGNIYAYRELNGKFKSVEDLVKVKGIGDKTLKKMKPFLTI